MAEARNPPRPYPAGTMMLNRDFGRTEPFEPPQYTERQHADMQLATRAGKRAHAAEQAAEHWQTAFRASCMGDEQSARALRAQALAALEMLPALRADIASGVHPVITRHDEARAVLNEVRDALERVRHSTIAGTDRATRMDIALEAVAEDLKELEAGR